MMKRRELLAGLAALGVASPVQAQHRMPLHDQPREMLSPPFVDGAGREMTLADFRGRVVLLNIWATWCVPCRVEMPTLDALQGNLGGDDFLVVPLSIDRAGMNVVRRFYEEIDIRHLGMYLVDGTRAMFAFGALGLPTTILIDRIGFERGRLVGPAEWDSPEIATQIQTLISEGNE